MASIKKIIKLIKDDPLKNCNAGEKTDKPREHKHRVMNFSDRGWGPLTMKLPRDDIFLQPTENKRGLANGHYGINHLG